MAHPQHHALSYVEFGVDDLAATQAFYEAAFGWRFNSYGPTYSGIQAPDGEGEVGGLDAGSQPGQGPLVLLYSTDLDATVDAVRDAGGVIVAGPYDFPGGRRFEFEDPSGNRLGVFADA